jgi:hypothetical protein
MHYANADMVGQGEVSGGQDWKCRGVDEQGLGLLEKSSQLWMFEPLSPHA